MADQTKYLIVKYMESDCDNDTVVRTELYYSKRNNYSLAELKAYYGEYVREKQVVSIQTHWKQKDILPAEAFSQIYDWNDLIYKYNQEQNVKPFVDWLVIGKGFVKVEEVGVVQQEVKYE